MLNEILQQRKPQLIKRWFDLILEVYPAETRKAMSRQKDQFANPVGYTIAEQINTIFDELLQGFDQNIIIPCLDKIVRIRAVQDCTASQAVAFVFLLKRVLRENLEKDLQDPRHEPELQELESRIDLMALLAFDTYMHCREQIFEIRANELHQRTAKIVELINRRYGGLGEESGD